MKLFSIKPLSFLCLLVFFLVADGSYGQSGKTKKPQNMKITSTVFQNNGMIPSKYTCDGVNVSPPLEWSGIPAGTKSQALICEDPDAPSGMWVHWVMFNIPPGIDKLPENFLLKEKPVAEIMGGNNDFRKLDYGGPCPPSGTHRYFFKIYALDRVLDQPEGINRKELLQAMEGHVLGQAEMVGTYKRK